MNRSVRIQSREPSSFSILQQLLSSLPESARPPDHVFELAAGESGPTLTLPDGVRNKAPDWYDLFYALESYLYDHLLPLDTQLFVLHTAAVLHRSSDSLVLLAGPSHCGKSSLSLALCASGRFDYLSEEAVGLSLEGMVVPYPKPFRIRYGLETVLDGRPGWICTGMTRSGIRYVIPPIDTVENSPSRLPVKIALFPEFAPGEPWSFRPLPRAEGIARLANCTTNRPWFLASGLSRLSALCRNMRAAELRWPGLEEAAEQIEAHLAEERA